MHVNALPTTGEAHLPDSSGPERWHPVADAEALQRSVSNVILAAAAQALAERGAFHLVLAGGHTPQPVYRALCTAQADWPGWHVYFGDERCLPPSHPERNSRMAAEVWLDQVPIPPEQRYTIPGELGAGKAACNYAELLRTVGDFDLVLLGLGEDGHTAGLFPGHAWGVGPDAPDALAVFDAPKPPPQRVSMSAVRLSRARQVLFLVNGEPKHRAVAAWRAGRNIPARAIRPAAGVDVFVEAPLLEPLIAAG